MKSSKTRPNGVARTDIIDASMRLFADRGFEGVSLREIAAAARVHVPAIYLHFADKRALYLASCSAAFLKPSHDLAMLLRDEASDAENMLTFMIGMCHVNLTNPVVNKLAQRLVLDDDRGMIKMLTLSTIDEYTGPVLHLIERLVGKKQARATAFNAFSMSYGASQSFSFLHAAGWVTSAIRKPAKLAEHILGVVIPHIDWIAVRKALSPEARALIANLD